MTALEEIKKAFPNMFRPLKWHHFDGPTEHGCGEWYAHATRGMYHIYDVREKFPNDRPFYAKELSDQFGTLEQAQDAVQNQHELDIVMCLDPDFRSTLASVQRENEELRRDRYDLAYAITGGEDAPGLLDSVPTSLLVEMAQDNHRRHCADIDRAMAAEAEVKRLRSVLQPMAKVAGDVSESWPDDAQVVTEIGHFRRARTALASTGGEHHAE